ncbi:MAG: ATP-binding cassette domain-containing protein [Bacteroidales bacterium]
MKLKIHAFAQKWGWQILSVGVLLLIWQVGALIFAKPFILPSCWDVIKYFVKLMGEQSFYVNLLFTFYRALIGFFLSALIALPVSYLCARNKPFEKLLSPILLLLKSTPILSFLLLAIIWFSSENIPLVIAFVGMFPILTIQFTAGFKALDPHFLQITALYHLSRSKRFFWIEYPAIKTYIFSGIASAIGLGWRAIIIGEALSSIDSGLGAAMKQAQNYIDVPYLFALTFASLFASFIIEYILKKLASYAPHKQHAFKHTLVSEKLYGEPLVIDNLSFRRNKRNIFIDFSLKLEESEIVAVQAVSGFGKSTLVDMVCGFVKPDSGKIWRSSTSVLFQNVRLLPWLSVQENIDLILPAMIDSKQRCLFYEVFGIEHLLDRYPQSLSGGEAQRVGLVRTLLYPCQLYILDEPLRGLDTEFRNRLLHFISGYVKEHNAALLWITHDRDDLVIADKILNLGVENDNQ